ncbi:MAG: hypothetical protein GX489_07060 [Firmicutes bacterium]|jgi:uncharacterized membrane-anchored protein|nr:hypothetical protein [Bacillota bacterium]
MAITGTTKIDRRTKNLVKRLQPGDIAIICHEDLDQVAAADLVAKKVAAVINARPSITGRYPNLGPQTLLSAGITLVDDVGEDIMNLPENCTITIDTDGCIYRDHILIAKGTIMSREDMEQKMQAARENIGQALDEFIDNTLNYAKREKYFITGQIDIPETDTDFKDKPVLVVARGNNFREDLAAIRAYVDDVKPLLVGVDGGADLLVEFGYRPDMVIGDMDSVSDKTLQCCREIVVHAYPDGRVPGLQRVQQLGLPAKIFTCPGTSEDIALLMAYEKGADLIVTVGSHSNMIDFLEKGRKGMASTFLVRLKVGSILVDAKGASKLYNHKINPNYILGLFIAALIPMIAVVITSPPVQYILKLFELKLKILFG